MRILKTAACLIMLVTVVSGASPQEEARFLQSVQEAFSKKDKAALIKLVCWDGVDQLGREMFQVVLDSYFDRDVKAVKYEPIATSIDQTRTNSLDGTVSVPNLVISKKLDIEYENGARSFTQTLKLAAGEKGGKLMLIQWIPKK